MALQISFQTQYGFVAETAYARITEYTVRLDKTIVQLDVYNNQDARLENCMYLGRLNVDVQLPDGGTKTDVYTAIKQLPDFLTAVDC